MSGGSLLLKHEVEFMAENSNENGHRKRICATRSPGYYSWIQMPEVKMSEAKKSIVKTTGGEIESFLADPTDEETLPHENRRYEWQFESPSSS